MANSQETAELKNCKTKNQSKKFLLLTQYLRRDNGL